MTTAWEGNPDKRIYERVKKLGYSTVREFAETKPNLSYARLAQELGDDVVGIQIEAVLADEYQDANELVRFIKSNLVRSIWENFPNGWDTEEDSNLVRAYTYADVVSSFVGNAKQIAKDGWESLTSSPRLYRGWLPENADDLLLKEAFER